jgi:hypothetical protein
VLFFSHCGFFGRNPPPTTFFYPVFSTSYGTAVFLFGYFLLALPYAWYCFPFARSTILLAIGYIFMYSSHWRSYYFLVTGEVTIWDTVRYMVNIAPIIAVLSAVPERNTASLDPTL